MMTYGLPHLLTYGILLHVFYASALRVEIGLKSITPLRVLQRAGGFADKLVPEGAHCFLPGQIAGLRDPPAGRRPTASTHRDFVCGFCREPTSHAPTHRDRGVEHSSHTSGSWSRAQQQ